MTRTVQLMPPSFGNQNVQFPAQQDRWRVLSIAATFLFANAGGVHRLPYVRFIRGGIATMILCPAPKTDGYNDTENARITWFPHAQCINVPGLTSGINFGTSPLPDMWFEQNDRADLVIDAGDATDEVSDCVIVLEVAG